MPLILGSYLVTMTFGIVLDFRLFICLLRNSFLSVVDIAFTIGCISKFVLNNSNIHANQVL